MGEVCYYIMMENEWFTEIYFRFFSVGLNLKNGSLSDFLLFVCVCVCVCEYTDTYFYFSYLNAQHIKKKKFTDADINYGGFGHLDLSEQMLEIGEVSRSQILEMNTPVT